MNILSYNKLMFVFLGASCTKTERTGFIFFLLIPSVFDFHIVHSDTSASHLHLCSLQAVTGIPLLAALLPFSAMWNTFAL